MSRTGDNELIKNLNYKIILDTIRTAGSISRIELSRITGLSRSTCSGICDKMLKQGLIHETGKSSSSGGRRPTLLEIQNRAGVVLGMKLMDGVIDGAVVDLGGTVLEHQVKKIPRHLDPGSYMTQISGFFDAVKASHDMKYPSVPILGIGVGISGRIDSKRGILIESSVLEWKDLHLKEMLEVQLQLPIFLENDVNSLAFGERYFGNGRDYENFLCLTIGDGIGLGIIYDGDLLSGNHNSAGEIGHMKVSMDPDAPECACGRKGCLEAYAADRAVLARYEQATGITCTIQELVNRAHARDAHAVDAFSTAGAYLGLALSTIVNLFDPQAVIIGGERVDAAAYFQGTMKTVFTENTVYNLDQEVEVIVMEPSNDLWVRGVAALAIREFFSRSESWEAL
ncbi:MAG: ROK family transcriptional regulator [Spirochaetia bacterium]|nr:ROK family transcriptional regulator [Spirochaetia bacterium]MCF7940061.1 ROK family transcriptional regulator [Spirochaetia bacterium]